MLKRDKKHKYYHNRSLKNRCRSNSSTKAQSANHDGNGRNRSRLDFSLSARLKSVRTALLSLYQDKESDKRLREIKSINITTTDRFVPWNDKHFYIRTTTHPMEAFSSLLPGWLQQIKFLPVANTASIILPEISNFIKTEEQWKR